jgi:hypothetical protein
MVMRLLAVMTVPSWLVVSPNTMNFLFVITLPPSARYGMRHSVPPYFEEGTIFYGEMLTVESSESAMRRLDCRVVSLLADG